MNGAGSQFCEQLCQALCSAMLRNAVSVYDEAHAAAVRLLACMLGQPPLRASLKAEMGAFVPLLLLRPLEQERQAPRPQSLRVSMHAFCDACAGCWAAAELPDDAGVPQVMPILLHAAQLTAILQAEALLRHLHDSVCI